jgi:hypothetical protein
MPYALQSKSYNGLTGPARAACVKLFVNQKWEMPEELTPRTAQAPPKVFTLWEAVQENWENVIPFFVFPEDIRRIIYTTNAIESLNMRLRKITKNRGHFPGDDSASKLIYLTLRNVSKKWTMLPHCWKKALTQFAIFFWRTSTYIMDLNINLINGERPLHKNNDRSDQAARQRDYLRTEWACACVLAD